MNTPLISIGPGDYTASSHTATFVDLLMDLAGVDKDACRYIQLIDGVWHFDIFCCDRKGKVRINRDGAIWHTETWAA